MRNNLWNFKRLEKESTAYLNKCLKAALKMADEHPEFKTGWHNEYVEYLKMVLASRIGK